MPFPRNYTCIDSEIESIRSLFSDRLEEPCFIVGNGPSSAHPETVPSDFNRSTVFRMNWFFLEEKPLYGTVVDGFFSSIEVRGLSDRIQEIQEIGPYNIRAFFQPFTQSSPDGTAADQSRLLCPTHDHWAVISSCPTLARYMMGRPLPTQGMQVIAFAAMLGFKDLHVSGIDLYAKAAKRYAWDVPKSVRQQLQKKDLDGGYEINHDLEVDLHFLRAVRSNFDFRMSGISHSEFLAPFLDRPPEPSVVIAKEQDKSFDKRRLAYATLVEGDYVLGAFALARSLAKLSDVPLIALYHEPDVGHMLDKFENVVPHRIEPLSNPHGHGQDRFAGTYSKLRVFELLDYDRIVFVDADCVILRAIDDLFDTKGLCAAPDWGNSIQHRFNSGVFAFSPSVALRDRVLEGIHQHPSYDGGDQGYLNKLFGEEWKPLPPEYNTLKRALAKHPSLVSLSDVKVLHFIGEKPWSLEDSFDEYDYLLPYWYEFLEPSDWHAFYWLARRFILRRLGKPLRAPKALPLRRRIIRLGRRLVPQSMVPMVKTQMKRMGLL